MTLRLRLHDTGTKWTWQENVNISKCVISVNTIPVRSQPGWEKKITSMRQR